MNKYINILASVALTMGAASCVDLDQYPIDQVSDGTYWKTLDDAEQVVTYLYEYLPGVYLADEDINTDNCVHGIKWAAGNLTNGIYDPLDFGWSSEYSAIRKANLVLEKIEEIENADDTRKKEIQGQALFFRALEYYQLIKQFGDVPLVLNTLELSDQEGITRTDWKTVYDQIMDDLNTAISYLPDRSPASTRASKGAAYTLKSRVALYFANPECKHYVSDGYRTAADAAKACMNLGTYSLYDSDYAGTAADYDGNYAKMFWNEGARNSEVILGQEYIEGSSDECWFLAFETFPTVGWGGLDPTQSFVDCFEDVEGAPISKSTIYDSTNPFANRDPRLEITVLHDGETMYGRDIKVAPLSANYPTGIGTHGDATDTGYYAQKYLDPSIAGEDGGWAYTYMFPSFRYTEVLLAYAEAMNELTPLADEAFDAVNQVRNRVGMPSLQKTDASKPTYCATQDDLRQRIRNEWRIEFAMEGDRRQWDCRRWNIAMDVFNQPRMGVNYTLSADGNSAEMWTGDHITVTLTTLRYSEHNYVYPIPQDEIDLNPNITQNEGY